MQILQRMVPLSNHALPLWGPGERRMISAMRSAAGPWPLLISLRWRILVLCCTQILDFRANVWFGMLGASALASLGILGRCWHTLEPQEDSLKSRRGCLLMFSLIQAAYSNDFWVWIWVYGIGKQTCVIGCITKIYFRRSLILYDSRVHFSLFWDVFGTYFHDFCCPGGWLENWWLVRVTLGPLQILSTHLKGGKFCIPGP